MVRKGWLTVSCGVILLVGFAAKSGEAREWEVCRVKSSEGKDAVIRGKILIASNNTYNFCKGAECNGEDKDFPSIHDQSIMKIQAQEVEKLESTGFAFPEHKLLLKGNPTPIFLSGYLCQVNIRVSGDKIRAPSYGTHDRSAAFLRAILFINQ